MDPVLMQAAPHRARKLHVPRRALALEIVLDLDVQGSDELGVAELPDVEVVAAQDAGEEADVFLDVVDGEPGGYGLEEDAGGGFAERDGGAEDDDGDDEGDGGVGVEAPLVVR